MSHPLAESVTPPQLAKMLRVSPKKVLQWIHAGELAATDLSSPTSRMPQFRITEKDLSAFTQKRAVRA